MLCLEPHGRGPRHLIYIHQISATPLEKHMDSNQMLQINTDLNAWRVIFCRPVCHGLRNSLRGQWRWGRRETAEMCPRSTFLYHALWIQHCPENYSSSPNRSPGKPRGRLKDGEKYAQGEISLLVFLHAAETGTITNTQRPNYIFWEEEERE